MSTSAPFTGVLLQLQPRHIPSIIIIVKLTNYVTTPAMLKTGKVHVKEGEKRKFRWKRETKNGKGNEEVRKGGGSEEEGC